MFHANTQRVIEDWSARRGDRPVPARADISPDDFRELLPQLFILGREGLEAEPFRLAGGLLADLHARDLRGVSFWSLWMPADRAQAREALTEARRTGATAVLDAVAWTAEGDEARIEIVLAPLTGPEGRLDRVLGLYQPTTSLRRLMGRPIEALTLTGVRLAGAAPRRPHLRLVALEGRRLD
jgi:hypothetical protein